jgi:hypothetical protein
MSGADHPSGVADQLMQCALIHLGYSLVVRALVLYRYVCKCIDHAWHGCMHECKILVVE